ncbi:hypothetical protein Golax_012282 [Gossypium laxum]|uniref:Uncharacterized protein n=1 Tax=Gossypium laxum TaxID=34288 RepID=A0A7J8ZPK4_9ROSI|nr:hypothetical protein [Gossypium laxum]
MSELIHSDKSDRDHVKEELSFISLSRFHQLPEFDHSCQMWLAGHYDRLKKPPLGSLLSSEGNGRESNSRDGGSFIMDFKAYPRRSGWPTPRSLEHIIKTSLASFTWNRCSEAHPTMPLWCICESLFKANNDSGSSSQEMAPTLGLGQIWDPINTQFFEGHELSQQSRRQYMEFEQSNAYDTSTQHIHWSP